MQCNVMRGFWLPALAWITALGCSGATAVPVPQPAQPEPDRPPAVTASADEVALAQSSNSDFAIALYGQLAAERPGENLFFSPFSISSALLIATEGASGETAEQMGKALRVPKALRNTAAEAAGLPWQLAGLHKGQAAIYYRLSPEPVSPELRDKIGRLRKDLAAANGRTSALTQSGKWDEAYQSQVAAQKLADELNPLLKETEPYVWLAANALWCEKTYPFRQSFLDTIHTDYGNALFAVDFRSSAESVRQQINAWAARQTRDRVTDFLGPGAVTPDTRLVITNAVYFKGEWLDPFDASSTRPADFHLSDGKNNSVPMMSKYSYGSAGYGAFNADGTPFDTPREIPVDMPDTDPSLYPDARGFTALRLPYKGGKLFMAMIVPRSAAGLGQLEQKLSATGFKPWLDRIANRTVIVNVPKFKMESDYGLEKSLMALGMVRAFHRPGTSDGAQFDRITATSDPAQQLFISAVRHKTFVEVNEKGTEAAAVTGVPMPATGPAHEPPKTRPFIPTFWADKPFLFAICDTETNSILFLGRLVRP
jgi:serine protease inhibitor